MYWFISALLLGCAIFLFAPSRLHAKQAEPHSSSAFISQFSGVPLAIIFAMGTLVWLIALLAKHHHSPYLLATFGFMLTASTLVIPRLRFLMMPSALLATIMVAISIYIN